jgi:hypothetical protein
VSFRQPIYTAHSFCIVMRCAINTKIVSPVSKFLFWTTTVVDFAGRAWTTLYLAINAFVKGQSERRHRNIGDMSNLGCMDAQVVMGICARLRNKIPWLFKVSFEASMGGRCSNSQARGCPCQRCPKCRTYAGSGHRREVTPRYLGDQTLPHLLRKRSKESFSYSW